MSDQPVNDGDFPFVQKDLEDPLKWVENLSEAQLLKWLRKVLWTGNALPIIVPSISRLAIEVSSLLKHGSSALKSRARAVVPILLQEWGRDDPANVLDDLLIICGRIRCAAAEPIIVLLMTERLQQQPEVVALRQRCLSVLSGFGCTERTVLKFKEYITDIDYAAICYRALYRYDLRYAATELQNILSIFQHANALDELNVVISNLKHDLKSPRQFLWVLARYLEHTNLPELFIHVLEVLRGAGLLAAAPFIEARPNERVEIYRLFLERCPPGDLQLLLWMLDSIGLGLYSMASGNEQEYIHGVAYDPMTERKVVDSVIATKDLSNNSVEALVAGSEVIAASWAAAPEIEWVN